MNEADRQILAAEIGGLIRDARENAGLSVAALADRLEVSRQWLARVESGETIPNVRRLIEIAAACHVDTAKILPD